MRCNDIQARHRKSGAGWAGVTSRRVSLQLEYLVGSRRRQAVNMTVRKVFVGRGVVLYGAIAQAVCQQQQQEGWWWPGRQMRCDAMRCDTMDGLSRAGLGVMRNASSCVRTVRVGGAVTLLAPTCTCGYVLDLLPRTLLTTRTSAPCCCPSKLSKSALPGPSQITVLP